MVALLEHQLAVPAFRVPLARRPRLVRALDDASSAPLTLVSAPAGTGKTVLLASWFADGRAGPGAAWVSVESGDDATGRFWRYVEAALVRAGVGMPPRRAASPDVVIRLATALASAPRPVLLVVDAAHHLAPATVGDLDRLVRLADGRLRLVAATRLVPLPQVLARRLSGDVAEVGRADLALTDAEVADVCRGTGLRGRDVARLVERTEGWAAAVRFAARAAARTDDPAHAAAAAWSGVDGEFAAWFSTHVLGTAPPEVRGALLRSAVADRLRPGLFDALVGDASGSLFTQLVRSGAFARATGTADEFQVGPLVANLLRAELTARTPELVPALHVTAARWCAEHGATTEALDHARAAGRWRETTEAVVGRPDFGTLLLAPGGTTTPLAAALAAVPPDASHEASRVARAAGALLRGDVHAAAARLTEPAPTRPATDAHALVVRHRAVVDLAVARARGDVEAGLAAAARVQDACAADGPRDADTVRVLVDALATQADLHAWSGDRSRARHSWLRGVAVADEAGDASLGEPCRAGLALLEAMQGDLRRAGRLAEPPRGADPATPRSAAAHVALAWVATEHVDLRAARRHVDHAGGAATPAAAAALTLVRARVLRLTGHVAEARRVLRAVADDAARPPAWLVGRVAVERAACDDLAAADGDPADVPADGLDAELVRARTRLARGDTARDPEFVDALGHAGAPLDNRVTGWLLEAERLVRLGRTRPATAALRHALHLAGRERLRRPFVEAHPQVLDLLRAQPRLEAAGRWLDGSGGARSDGGDEPAVDATAVSGTRRLYPVEPLTARERETLVHLAALLSTEETAASMGVSVNTVRTHVRHILAKLSASGRNEAIRRARDLDLLSA